MVSGYGESAGGRELRRRLPVGCGDEDRGQEQPARALRRWRRSLVVTAGAENGFVEVRLGALKTRTSAPSRRSATSDEWLRLLRAKGLARLMTYRRRRESA
ncbi:MAG TPA: hypothetical protein VEK14_01425 [Rhodomicrobium sp.]|nr:hypothetical protein [Rhodomicrobium sp.]